MSVKFPCLSTDLSDWLHSEPEMSISRSVQAMTIDNQNAFTLPSSLQPTDKSVNNWLVKTTQSEATDTHHIMAPVLQDRPKSYWLMEETDQERPTTADEMKPNLLTSIWLASTSTSSLTCSTANRANGIELPKVLTSGSVQNWLYLANGGGKLDEKDQEEISKWLVQGKQDNVSCKANITSSMDSDDLNKWLICETQQCLKTIKQDLDSDVDQWLLYSKSTDDDDSSSIAILSCSEFELNHDDVVMEVVQEETDDNDDYDDVNDADDFSDWLWP